MDAGNSGIEPRSRMNGLMAVSFASVLSLM